MDVRALEFQLSDPDEFARRLTAVGLKQVMVEVTSERPRFGSGVDVKPDLYGNPLGEMVVGDRREEQRSTIRQVHDDILRRTLRRKWAGSTDEALHIAIEVTCKRATGFAYVTA